MLCVVAPVFHVQGPEPAAVRVAKFEQLELLEGVTVGAAVLLNVRVWVPAEPALPRISVAVAV